MKQKQKCVPGFSDTDMPGYVQCCAVLHCALQMIKEAVQGHNQWTLIKTKAVQEKQAPASWTKQLSRD